MLTRMEMILSFFQDDRAYFNVYWIIIIKPFHLIVKLLDNISKKINIDIGCTSF